ncbi:BREX-1 system adenine-specific DNA-methyltransferase PglX [Microbacterium sp. zg.B48]|uniref:BREX-1 system adenine-specific DNA-methyltransferase PglX n=1 Tax=Microbacterium sp. zg.B48 TaxID=2969408 RepID=UPI00214C5FD3|nr:BREX-1 system adenine-specific DNA-methyltransferase PglX [Microbacterium sp. zg.B48]MCR2763851.1 BREX-1 system adenine-specific DNA-methyltransferase PglX [Microbacterium sp. zg.B48]
MDTATLKSFATSARIELIREVGARITAVLAQGSPERVEQPRAVTSLERAIRLGGGGEKGKTHVADRVAYTWFNRIIALRFMDANSHTAIGVVSPAVEHVGQPEVLAAAKRGQIDGDVVKGANASTITGLLNGTRQPRPGVDAQAEAYALLLADYCRYWNRAMPFMFEREGDYTELLIPANLLAEDSALNRSVKVLTEEVCRDVEVIGWLYQFYISERKDEVFAGFKKNRKAGADEIPAATQLFTPHWIVRYLVENSLGRLWMLNHPESRLVDQMDYYISPVDEETDFLKVTKPEDLTVIDPACGSGHMLTYAFDLLYAIYEEEGYTPSQIPNRILTNNLYGTEIDPRAGALAAFALTMKAAAKRKLFLKNPVEPNISVLSPMTFTPEELDYLVTADGDRHAEEAFWNQFADADTFGSLIQPDPGLIVRLAGHLDAVDDRGDILRADALNWAQLAVRQAEDLVRRYSVVVTNPPYMGNKNMKAELSTWLNDNYPASKSDLMTAFMQRCSALCERGGRWAMINLPTWMSLKSYEKLRTWLLRTQQIETLVQPGRGVFGSDFGSVAFVVAQKNPSSTATAVYRRLFTQHVSVRSNHAIEALFRQSDYNRFEVSQASFLKIPGFPLAYWLSDEMLDLFSKGQTLGKLSEVKHGLSTGKNEAVLRFWWEVSSSDFLRDAGSHQDADNSGAKWFPYNKGGAARRWFGNVEQVIRYDRLGRELMASFPGHRHDGRSHYFVEGITWSKVTAGRPSFRLMPRGQIFDVAGNSFFPNEVSRTHEMLAVVNSSTIKAVLEAIAPTVNFEAGQVGSLPVLSVPGRARELADELVAVSIDDWNSAETSWGFTGSPGALSAADREDARSISSVIGEILELQAETVLTAANLETELNELVAEAYGVADDVSRDFPVHDVTLSFNPAWKYGDGKSAPQYDALRTRDFCEDLVSYAVGCMFGRYSLDEAGLILADQGATLQDYLAKVPTPTFTPDADNVIPIVEGDWFEDDIVDRFRHFLRVVFGEQHFEENLQFVTDSLGVKSLRDYFAKSFYKDHVQRYKKRPIYWLFSSPKGSFNALIFMHRYTPSTVSTVLTYLREYVTKLESALQRAERAGNAKEADRFRRILVELNEYEHDTLFPKASENVVIDLDDGVKANYPKFGAALKKIPGLEAASD